MNINQMRALRPFSALCATGAGLILSASVATAQSASFGPDRSTVDGGTVTINVAVPTNVTGDATVNLTYFGDLGLSNEFISVAVEGTGIGTLPGGTVSHSADCRVDYAASLTIPEATFIAAAADGTLTLTFSAPTRVNDFCSTRDSAVFSYPEGGASRSDGDTSYAVLGSLAFAVVTSAGPATTSASPEADMLANRGAMILAHTLNTPRRIRRLREGSAVTRETLSFAGVPVSMDSPVALEVNADLLDFATGSDVGNAMVWMEGRLVALEDDIIDDARFGILHFGVDWRLSADTMIGVAAQIDSYRHEENSTGDDFSGLGWMIGPILTHRLTQDVYLDARLAFGQASNEVERSGGTDDFDSDRMLAELAVTGEMAHGAYTVYPEVEIAYFDEESEGYTSATLGAVAATDVALTQARFRALIERPFEFTSGQDAIGFVDVRGVYSNTLKGDPTTGSYAEEIEGWSGEAEFGMRYQTSGDATVDAALGFGGLFTEAESYFITLAINIPTR